MKKLFISMFALAAVITSCSKSEVMSSRYENIPISFTTYNGRTPEVKATEVTSLTSFYVLADLVKGETTTEYFADTYNNTAVETDNGFANGEKYWPGEGSLNFYAYNVNDIVTLSNRTLTISVPENAEAHKDIVVANATNQKFESNQEGKVNLTFKHALARVHFAIESDSEKDLITIHDLQFTNLFKSGTVDLTAEKLEAEAIEGGDESVADYTYNGDILISDDTDTKGAIYTGEEDDAVNNRYMMIIPQVTKDVTISIKYTFNGNTDYKDEYNVVNIADNFEFKAGYSYLFKLKIKSNAITFIVDVTPWIEGSTNDNYPLN